MTIGAGVSRWTMLHLGTAVVALLLALGLLASGFADVTSGLAEPNTLAVVHLITIGWLSVMMLGALYQFVPVITSTTLYSQRLPILSYAALIVGLAAMVAGFLALGGVTWLHVACLPVGGALVVAGLALGALNVGVTLWRARPLGLPARFAALGLGFLLLTGLVGLGFALAFALPDPPDWLIELLAQGLMVHVLGGLGGWLTLTAMGVSYRLLSMFMLAPEEPDRTTHFALWLTAGGLLWYTLAGLAAIAMQARPGMIAAPGAAVAFIGALFYLVDMVRLYRTRARRHLELNSITAGAALALFGCALIGTAVAAAFGQLERCAPALGYLFVFGWLSGLGLSQLYKIVPFMTWLDVFGKKLGKGPVPRVQDMVNERRAAPWFVLYFLAVPGATVALALQAAPVVQGAAVAQLAAVLALSVELWRAHHPDPNAAPKPIVPAALRPANAPGGPGGHPTQRG